MTRTRSHLTNRPSLTRSGSSFLVKAPLKVQTARRGRRQGTGRITENPSSKMLALFVKNISNSIEKSKAQQPKKVQEVIQIDSDTESEASVKIVTQVNKKPAAAAPESEAETESDAETEVSVQLVKTKKRPAVIQSDTESEEETEVKIIKTTINNTRSSTAGSGLSRRNLRPKKAENDNDSTSNHSASVSGRVSESEADSGFKSFEDNEEESEHSRREPSSDISRARSVSPAAESQYEIEDVIDYVHETTGADKVGEMYLVKWKNWEPHFNTWEPAANLVNCEEALLKFYFIRKAEVEKQISSQIYVELPNGKRRRKGPGIWKIPPDPRPLEVRLREFYEANQPLDKDKLSQAYEQWNEKRRINNGKDVRVKWISAKLNKFLTDGTEHKLTDEQMEELWKELYFVEIERKKEKLDEKLKKWERKINTVTLGRPVISVENNVDFVLPPNDFTYVSKYICSEGIVMPDDPPVGCSCTDNCYENRKNCCSSMSGEKFAYSRFKKIAVPIGTPIWECNKKCACGPDCINRVVQDGKSDFKFAIFRTSNECGWGVKALKLIKKGSFVCLYVGEVIFTADVERRSRAGAQTTYVFDLDFNEDAVYSVDASKYGNFSHFINHSCDPNLAVFNVWVDCLDPNLPKLAMFANRDIAKDEELSFDYTNQLSYELINKEETPGPRSPVKPSGNAKKLDCLCGAENCRKFIYV